MKNLIILICLSLTVVSCQQTVKEMSLKQRSEIADSIKLYFQNTVNNAKLDIDEWMNVWVEDDDGVWIGNPALWTELEKTLTNKMEIYNEMEFLLNGDSAYVNKFITIKRDYAAVINPEHVIYAFNGYLNGFAMDTVSYKPKASGTCIFIVRSGQWKLLHFNLSLGDLFNFD